MRRKFSFIGAGSLLAAVLLFGTVGATAAPEFTPGKVSLTEWLAMKYPNARDAIQSLPASARTEVDEQWRKYLSRLETGMFGGLTQKALEAELDDEDKAAIRETEEKVEDMPEEKGPPASGIERERVEVLSDFQQERANREPELLPQNETPIAVNPVKPNNLVAGANDYRTGGARCGLYVSLDGGKTFLAPDYDNYVGSSRSQAERIGSQDDHQHIQPFPTGQLLPGRGSFSGDPAIDFDAEGVAYYACLNIYFDGPDGFEFRQTLEVSKSTDEGRTWSFPVTAVTGGSSFSFEECPGGFRFLFTSQTPDKEFISAGVPAAADPEVPKNKVYMTYTNFFSEFRFEFCEGQFRFFSRFGENIEVVRSPDGVIWRGPVILDTAECITAFPETPETEGACDPRVVQGSNPYASHKDGRLYVVWYDSGDGQKSGPGPTRAPFPVENDGWRTGRFTPEIARSMDGGKTFDPPFGGRDVAEKCENAGGTRGSIRTFVMPPTPFRGWPTMFPVVRASEVDPNRVYVAFGADPATAAECPYQTGEPLATARLNDDADAFLAYSLDGGQTFAGATMPGPVGRSNDDRTRTDQFFTWLAIQPPDNTNGKRETVWQSWGDRRRDIEDVRYDVFATRFPLDARGIPQPMTNVRVTSPATPIALPVTTETEEPPGLPEGVRPSDARVNPQAQFFGTFIGDYFGLDVSPTHVYPSWTDTRFEANQDAFVGVAANGAIKDQPRPATSP